MSATVLKIGGSLLESDAAAQLMRALAAHRPRQLVIVPGGGEFADAVRVAQVRHGFGEAAAHHMALLAMHMVGRILADFVQGFVLAQTMEEFASAWRRDLTPIWAPACLVLAETRIPPSWGVTSDSLAAWLARHIGAARLILAKSCAVPAAMANNARELAAAGIVDAGFPQLVDGQAFSWRIVSGAEEAVRTVCL